MAAKIWSGDFYQLPPAPQHGIAAGPCGQTVLRALAGQKLLLGIPYVLSFANIKRFAGPGLLYVPEAMRAKGGKKLKDRVWARLIATVCKKGATPASWPHEGGTSAPTSGRESPSPCTCTRA